MTCRAAAMPCFHEKLELNTSLATAKNDAGVLECYFTLEFSRSNVNKTFLCGQHSKGSSSIETKFNI